MTAPNNPKTQNCSKCGTSLKDKWWRQIGHRVFCKKHAKRK